MKTIVVATDFSAAASNAATYAADMALAVKADLFLLHVYQLPMYYGEVPVQINVDDWQKDAENSLYQLRKELEKQTQGQVTIHTEVRLGNYLPELEAVCEKLDPYTVIIGSTGKSAAERVLFGSNAVYAMKHLAWPVITVPYGTKFTSIHKIGLACDLANVANTVPVDELSLLVNDFNAELHVLNIGKEEAYDPDTIYASGLLGEMLVKVKPQFHFLSHKDTDQGILDFAEKNNIDLLIVLPKRRSLPEAIMHKSHTKQFVLHSHVPLMALHAHTHTA